MGLFFFVLLESLAMLFEFLHAIEIIFAFSPDHFLKIEFDQKLQMNCKGVSGTRLSCSILQH